MKLIFFKNIYWRQPHNNVQAIKLNFIQQVCLQNFLGWGGAQRVSGALWVYIDQCSISLNVVMAIF